MKFPSLLSSKNIFANNLPYAFNLLVNEATAVFEIFTSVSISGSIVNLAIVANFYAFLIQLILNKIAKMNWIFFEDLNSTDPKTKYNFNFEVSFEY